MSHVWARKSNFTVKWITKSINSFVNRISHREIHNNHCHETKPILLVLGSTNLFIINTNIQKQHFVSLKTKSNVIKNHFSSWKWVIIRRMSKLAFLDDQLYHRSASFRTKFRGLLHTIFKYMQPSWTRFSYFLDGGQW